MIISESSRWRKVAIALLIAVLISVALFAVIRYAGKSFRLFSVSQKNFDYIIPGVPYIGIYTRRGAFANLSYDTPSAVASILEYWAPGENNFVEINNSFWSQSNQLISGDRVQEVIEKQGGFKAERVHLEINELKKYINSEQKTPLFMFLPVSSEQPLEIFYHPAGVLIGIKESEKKIIMHDYWFGNNIELTFDEFQKHWDRMRPDERNEYIVIQPQNLAEKLKEVGTRNFSGYPARTQTMQKAQTLFKNYAIGWGASLNGLTDTSIDYLNKTKNDPDFDEYFPPVFKVRLSALLAEELLRKKDLDKALTYATESVSLNHELDKPFGDWPGWEDRRNRPGMFNQMSYPYLVLGDIYKAKGDFLNAKTNFEKTLEIYPGYTLASDSLKLVELELAKQK